MVEVSHDPPHGRVARRRKGVGVSTAVAYEASSYADINVLDPEGNRDVWILDRVQLDRGWEAHDGAGWYLHLDEYPEEGSVGAFATRDEAVAWVQASGGILFSRRRAP
jgi:hypothetical protein